MVNVLNEKGREGFLDGSIDFDTNTIGAMLSDLTTADVAVKAITGATNATPIVITATAHGFANGDLVYVDQVGGNLAANGLWKIANQATNTFELTDPVTGSNAVGSAAYTSGGVAVCLGVSAAADNIDDYSATRVGTDVNLGSPTVVAGVADAADPTFTGVTGNTIRGVVIYKNTGTESTGRVIGLITGKFIVTAAVQASASATSIVVDKLPYTIPNGTVLTFSNGATATLTAQATAGARSLTVSALAAIVTADSRALSPILNSGFPIATPSGVNIVVAFDNGTNKIFKL